MGDDFLRWKLHGTCGKNTPPPRHGGGWDGDFFWREDREEGWVENVEILGMLSVYHSFLILFSVEILGMFKY